MGRRVNLTEQRAALAGGIDRGEVDGYPGWVKPRVWWRPGMLREDEVTAEVGKMLDADPPLAAWAREPVDACDKVPVVLTDAGREWRDGAR